MSRDKTTRILLREDEPASITSSRRGANLDAIVFNMRFLLQKQPSLAVKVTKLYDQARQLRPNDPPAPDEDFREAEDKWSAFAEDLDL